MHIYLSQGMKTNKIYSVLHKQGAKLRVKQRFPASVIADEDLPTSLPVNTRDEAQVDVITHLTSKNSLHIMLAKNHTIHLVKIFEGRISTTYCDVGVNSKINRVAADFSHNNIIYALTEANEIIVIEQKNNNQVKGDAIECKTLGRLYLPTETPNLYTFASVKHGLLLLNRPSGELYLLDTSDLATLLQSPQLVLIYRFPPHQVANDLRALDIKEVRANSGNLIAMNTKRQNTQYSY